MSTIERVGVVGCGLMGSGIAEVCARAGLDVVVREVDAGGCRGAASTRGHVARPRRARRQARPRRTATPRSAGSTFTTDIADLADRQLVVEAVVEDEALKIDDLPRARQASSSRPDAILASNTSSIPIMKLGMATERPEQVIGIHFFNPVPVLRLVELVPSLLTVARRPSTRADDFATDVLDKQVDPLARTAPASSSTRCSSRTCCRRSG